MAATMIPAILAATSASSRKYRGRNMALSVTRAPKQPLEARDSEESRPQELDNYVTHATNMRTAADEFPLSTILKNLVTDVRCSLMFPNGREFGDLRRLTSIYSGDDASPYARSFRVCNIQKRTEGGCAFYDAVMVFNLECGQCEDRLLSGRPVTRRLTPGTPCFDPFKSMSHLEDLGDVIGLKYFKSGRSDPSISYRGAWSWGELGGIKVFEAVYEVDEWQAAMTFGGDASAATDYGTDSPYDLQRVPSYSTFVDGATLSTPPPVYTRSERQIVDDASRLVDSFQTLELEDDVEAARIRQPSPTRRRRKKVARSTDSCARLLAHVMGVLVAAAVLGFFIILLVGVYRDD